MRRAGCWDRWRPRSRPVIAKWKRRKRAPGRGSDLRRALSIQVELDGALKSLILSMIPKSPQLFQDHARGEWTRDRQRRHSAIAPAANVKLPAAHSAEPEAPHANRAKRRRRRHGRR